MENIRDIIGRINYSFFRLFLFLLLSCYSENIIAQSESWTFISTPFEYGTLYDIKFANENNGWAVGYNEGNNCMVILCTSDAGNNWQLQENSIQGFLLSVFAVDSQTVYSVGNSGGKIAMVKTTNGGQTWTQVVLPVIQGILDDVFFTSLNDGWAVGTSSIDDSVILIHTTDGTTWTQVNLSFTASWLAALYFSDNLHGWIAGAEADSLPPLLLKTIDGGNNWVKVNVPVTQGMFIDVCFTNNNFGMAVGSANDSGLICKTEDGGETWKIISISPTELLANEKQSLNKNNSTTGEGHVKLNSLYLDEYLGFVSLNNFTDESMSGLLYQTTDYGETWRPTLEELVDEWINKMEITDKSVYAALSKTVEVGEETKSITKIAKADKPETLPPPVRAWVDENSVLHIVLWADANVIVGCQNGKVMVNLEPVGDPPVEAKDIKGIDIKGGDFDNLISVNGVLREEFTNLQDYKIAINAGAGKDGVIGSEFSDLLNGEDGDDNILGGTGGDDIVNGGKGEDYIRCLRGDQILNGGEGNDKIEAGDGNSTLNGGPGKDFLDGYGTNGNKTFLGGDGDDMLWGGKGKNTFVGGKGNDDVWGDVLDDKYFVVPGSIDSLFDESGNDSLDFSGAEYGIEIDLDLLSIVQIVDINGNEIVLNGQFENFVGSQFNDVVTVKPLLVPRLIVGGTGTDTLIFDALGADATDSGTQITIAGCEPVTYSGFETIIVTGEIPVELTAFTASAEEKYITLKWITASEKNNYGFEVERASTPLGMTWEKIGFVEGKGTTTEANKYSFNYNSPLQNGVYKFRLKQLDLNGSFTYSTEVEVEFSVKTFSLEHNYPNPFNPTTTIEFSLPVRSKIRLEIYNMLGEKLVTLFDEVKDAGIQEVQWDANAFSSGIYFYRIHARPVESDKEYSAVKKMIIVK